MDKQKNPCIRCGRERIIIKSWEEQIGTAMAKMTLATCPDPECQKLVDAVNLASEEKRLFHYNKRLQAKKSPFSRVKAKPARSGK